MSAAVEASSSQEPAAAPLPEPPAAGRAGGASQAPPLTLFKQKIRWSCASYAGDQGAKTVRLLTWEGTDVSRVKGDDSEEPPETDREWNARIAEEANKSGLQEELLLHDNDVVREQVKKATDTFVADSVFMAEEEDDGLYRGVLEEVLGTKAKFGKSFKDLGKSRGGIGLAAADIVGEVGAAAMSAHAPPAAQKEGPSMVAQGADDNDDDFVNPPWHSVESSSSKAAVDKEPLGTEIASALNQIQVSAAADEAEEVLSATTAVRGLGSKLSFGRVFSNAKVADALVRTLHAPMCKVQLP